MEDQFPCPHCEKVFDKKRGLIAHVSTVHSGRPRKKASGTFWCDHCTEGPFKTKAGLGSHLAKTHGIAGQSSSAYYRAKEVKKKRKTALVPVVEAEVVHANGKVKPVPECAFCPACGLPLALFHKALEVVANAQHED